METAILLSTYNGELFFEEQLRSIFNQQYPHWKLFIRDDGSTDGTLAMIKKYQSQNPGKIIFIQDNFGNVGAKKSFSILLDQCDADYIAFADQDDIWKPEKLLLTMNEIKNAENKFGKGTPLLIHHDLEIANEKMEIISDSFYSFTGLSAVNAKQTSILWRNVIPGCSMMINKALAEEAGEIPAEAVMHDYWLVLFAHFTGQIFFIPQSLTIYRQHGKNRLGAEKKKGQKSWKEIFGNIRHAKKNPGSFYNRYKAYCEQAKVFAQRFSENDSRINVVRSFISLNESSSPLKKRRLAFQNHFYSGSFKEKIEQLFSW